MKKPLKILHLVGDHEDAGGVLSVIRNLQKVTPASSMEHAVWVKEGYRESRKPPLQYRYSRYVVAESIHHWKLLAQAWPAFKELQSLLSNEPFHLLHAHSRGTLLVAILASKVLRRKVLFTNHNYAQRTGLYRWAARQPRIHTVMLTPNMARHYNMPESGNRTSIISACFAQDLLTSPIPSLHATPPRTSIKLVGVGNVIGWKKWDLILKALELLEPSQQSKLCFDIWGPTPDLPEAIAFEKALRERLHQAGLEDSFRLRGPTHEVEAKIREADWFILPSTNEPCSVALMEALALGCPALVSASGGNVDIIKESCGKTFQPDDPESLADALRELLQNPRPKAIPEAIRESVKHRSASVVFNQYEKLYHHLNGDLT